MDELMKQQLMNNKSIESTTSSEITCSVHFTNPNFRKDASDSSIGELAAVTRLVATTEELELDRVFKPKDDGTVKPTDRSLFEYGHNFETVPGWSDHKQPQKTQLPVVLRYMIERHLKTTVQIEINKMFFNCHLAVLQVYSKFFMELEEQQPLLLTLPQDKVSQKAFLLIYKWMLSDAPRIERKHIVEVFIAATYLRIDSLLQQCWQYFDDERYLTEDSACVLYVESLYHPALDIVRNLMLTRIQKFLLTFVSTSDFLRLPVSHVIFLLSSSSIYVNTEIEIFFIIVRWLEFDWSGRLTHLLKLIKCIRFNLMPLWYLLCVHREETHSIMMDILKNPDVSTIINNAIADTTAAIYEERRDDLPVDHLNILRGPKQRKWLQDKDCPYYHLISCPRTRDIRYSQFEMYMSSLQERPMNYWKEIPKLDLENVTKCCDAKGF